MGRNKIGLNFKAFEEYAEKVDRLGGDLRKITERALKKSHEHVTEKIRGDMGRHHRTGRTEGSIHGDSSPTWTGMTAEVKVGFTFSQGLASVFLMYGTPRMAKDQKLYNDIYGAATVRAIGKLQQEEFEKEISRTMGG